VARRSSIRASDADRDGVVDRLRDAAAEGRLAAHELEHRVTAALRARTYGELDATVRDLPSTAPRGRRRVVAKRTVSLVREHPVTLLAVIPITVVIVAAMLTIMMISATIALLALLLGHRRRAWGRPMYRL